MGGFLDELPAEISQSRAWPSRLLGLLPIEIAGTPSRPGPSTRPLRSIAQTKALAALAQASAGNSAGPFERAGSTHGPWPLKPVSLTASQRPELRPVLTRVNRIVDPAYLARAHLLESWGRFGGTTQHHPGWGRASAIYSMVWLPISQYPSGGPSREDSMNSSTKSLVCLTLANQ
jgi:hypothetical protein